MDKPKKKKSKAKVLAKAVDYGLKGAGLAGIFVGALALFITITGPIGLLIIGIVAGVFCCIGGISEVRKPDFDKVEHGRNVELKLEHIEGDLKKLAARKDKSPLSACVQPVSVMGSSLFREKLALAPQGVWLEVRENEIVGSAAPRPRS